MNEPQMNSPARPVLNNWLVPAILATIFCCLPAGIVAIVYANQVNTKLLAGDYNGALQSSQNAKTWTYVSVGLAALVVVGWFLLVGLGLLSSGSSS